MNQVSRLSGSGPLTFTTGTDLSPRSHFAVLDVNGYYYRLGIRGGWLGGTTVHDIRRGFRLSGGPESAWLTHVVTLLLDKDFRLAYDRSTSLVVDEYVRQAMRRTVNDFVSRQRSNGRPQDEIDDFLRGLDVLPEDESDEDEDTPAAPLDNTGQDDKDACQRPFSYSYWRAGEQEPSAADLYRWQKYVVSALRAMSLRIEVSLGWGTFLPWDVERDPSSGVFTVVCGVTGPTRVAAFDAALTIKRFLREHEPNPTTTP